MALKGHTKIELTNVNTGEVEVYEDDNMVTNALENYFQSLGVFGSYSNLISSQSLSNFLRRFTNGLFLFDKPLEERPDNLLPPGGTQLTGRGSILVYDGVDKTMGSYSSQSKKLYNGYGYEHVWEFNTNQANGKIACACLTTSLGAKVGTGTKQSVDNNITTLNNDFDTYFYSANDYSRVSYYHLLVKIMPEEESCWYVPNFSLYDNKSAAGKYFIHTNYNQGRYVGNDYESNNYVNQTDLNNSIINTHDLTFYRYRTPFNNLSLFEYQHGTDLLETKTIHLDELDTIITDAMKTCSSTQYYYNYDVITKNDYMYFYFNYCRSSNGIFFNTTANSNNGYVWKINLETFEVEKFFEIKNIITNNKQGKGMFAGYYDSTYNRATSKREKTLYITDNEYLITMATFNNNGSTGYGLCKIDLNNQIDFDWISWDIDGTPSNWGNISLTRMFDYNNIVYLFNNSNHYVYCIDLTNNTYYNVTNQYHSFYIPEYHYYYSNGFLFHYHGFLFLMQQGYGGPVCRFSILPNMLVTINNLPQEIIKSPEQTMKVTYTIVDDNYVTD